MMVACLQKTEKTGKAGEIRLMILDPGHFHADLLLKQHSDRIARDVYVYAPEGTGLKQHLERVASFAEREDNPVHWNEIVYSSPDFLEIMLKNPAGNVVVLAGNNRTKTEYIARSVNAGLHVLADKPLAINEKSFQELEKVVALAQKQKRMVYDMMTERYEILNQLQRELIADTQLFGMLEKGSVDEPAVELESTHHFYKMVSGSPLVRPAWYYDVEQQGEGLADVSTHLIDIVHWKCLPELTLDYRNDIRVLSASHWPTPISKDQFTQSTQEAEIPLYLQKYVQNDTLNIYANGKMVYAVKGIHVSLLVRWNFQAPEGTGDTHTSCIKGTGAIVEVVQDESTAYKPELFVRATDGVSKSKFETALNKFVSRLQQTFPDITLKPVGDKIQFIVPAEYREGHEAHFARVAETFFGYLDKGKMPDWEMPNTLAKYYITTTAVKMANAR
ncbi:MAG: putative oxidoreductase C-terminal domain-containing protein [Paludibacter sp.]|jgi:predicted dehydrogenase|nr:putative oxidoreductase C-terminal domain-containing protein [Paludibacter sp.]